MREVELHPAHMWTCEDCGRDNFCRGVVYEMNAQEKQEMSADYGIEGAVTGDWMTAPDQVTCEHCGSEFNAKDQRE